MPAVNIPNVGTVNFPDSMSQADIITAIKTQILPKYGQQAAPKPPTLMDKVKGDAAAALEGAGQVTENAGLGVYNAVNSLEGLGAQNAITPDNLTGMPAAQAHPIAAAAGGIGASLAFPAGRVAEGAGLLARLGTNALTGAAYGAANANSNPYATGTNILTNAVEGGALGAALPEGIRALNIARPAMSMLQKLQAQAAKEAARGQMVRSALPGEAAANLQNMQQLGVERPTLGQVTNSPEMMNKLAGAVRMPLGAKVDPLADNAAQGDIAAQHLMDHLAGGTDYNEMDGKIVSDLQGLTNDNKGFSGAVYKSLSNIVKQIVPSVNKDNAQAFGDSTLKTSAQNLAGGRMAGIVNDKNVADLLTSASTPYSLPRNMELQDLIDDRATVGQEIGNQDIPNSQTKYLKGLYGAFTKDIESNLNKVVPPDLKEQWANDFTNQVNQVTSEISHPENAAKLQADALAIKNKILGNDNATLKDIWQEANDWHKNNVAPLQDGDVEYHTYNNLGTNVARTLMQEQNQDAFKLLPQSTQKLVLASKFKKAIQSVEETPEGLDQGVVNLNSMAKAANNLGNEGLSPLTEGLTYKTPGGTEMPLKDALRNIVRLNSATAPIRPLIRPPVTGAVNLGAIKQLRDITLGDALGGAKMAAGFLAAGSLRSKLTGKLMQDPNMIKAYANPAERMDFILKALAPNAAVRGVAKGVGSVADLINRGNVPAASAYLLNQNQQ